MLLSSNHKLLSLTAFIVFTILSVLIAVVPAMNMQESVRPLSQAEEMTYEESEGLRVFISEGCVGCHTQQVRSIEMDEIWGNRPSLPSDYYYSKKRLNFWQQTPSLLGSERTGPDLTDIGNRQPSEEWHMIHLYNPRIVVKESIMPSYPWLFKEVWRPDSNDVVVNVPDKFKRDTLKQVVALAKANYLVAYIKSLSQVDPSFIYDDFIPSSKEDIVAIATTDNMTYEGKALFQQFCASCHQPSGEGLPGAFPPLKGSEIVQDDNPELMIRIILQGYDARTEYGVMPPFADLLSDAEITAIVNYERNSWGNESEAVEKSQVKSIRAFVDALNQ